MALKRLVKIIAGQSPPSDSVTDFEGDGLPFLQGNAEFGAKNPAPIHRCDSSSKRCDAGDILISVRAPVGALNIADRQYGIGRGLCAVHPDKVDRQFLWWLLHASVTQLQSLAAGSTYDAVSAEDLGSLRVTAPSLNEQQVIANYVDTETAKIDALIQKKQRMIELLDKRIATSISMTTAAHSIQEHDTLPEGWRLVPLRRCFTSIDYGIGIASEATGKIAVLGMGNVDGGRIIGDPSGYVDEVDSWLLLQDSDLLFNRTNSLALVSKVAIWPGSDHPTTFASYLVRLRTGSLANARYLNYLLNSQEMLGFARAIALPSIGQANLNPSRYTSTHIPLPPLTTQQVIVDLLDSQRKVIHRATAALSRQLDLLVERRQALISAAVTGELDIPGASE